MKRTEEGRNRKGKDRRSERGGTGVWEGKGGLSAPLNKNPAHGPKGAPQFLSNRAPLR
jgi:hypothetical protein